MLQEGRDGKVGCRFHLPICTWRLTLELIITEGNKEERQTSKKGRTISDTIALILDH